MRMYNPPHPGEILRDMWLTPLKLSITQAAHDLWQMQAHRKSLGVQRLVAAVGALG